jgi:acetylglutamate kinase
MDVIEMVLTGRVNKSLVNLINQAGGKAVGLSGKDANLILAEQHPNKALGLVGKVKSINPEIIKQLLADGYIPVISTVGVDEAGQVYNINADVAAGDIAIALQAEKLIALSNVPGILDKDKQLIKQVSSAQIQSMIEAGTITGGMIPKVESLLRAIGSGVQNVHVISGESEHSILLELFTDYGIGTMIKAGSW